MGRHARINYPDLTYHIINRGNNREVIFAEAQDYEHYLNTVQRYKKKYHFKLFAFCLMTNHVHLLIKISKYGSISRIMQSITIAHTRRFNFKYQRCGHIWQGRFHSPIVSNDDYLLKAMQYIEQNPLRAKMVKSIADYAYSSYRLNIRKKEPVLIDRSENSVFQLMGKDNNERIRQYKKLMAQEISEKELDNIHVSTRQGKNYLSPKFEEQIVKILPHRRKKGRPKKDENVFRKKMAVSS